jgi:hypothetical protein
MTKRPLPSEPGKRTCLKCGKTFDSRDAGNRICENCSSVNAGLNVSEEQLARQRGTKRLNGFDLNPPYSY